MSTEPFDLDAAQALADAATPGPWATDGDYDRAEVSQTVEPFATIVGTETTGPTYLSYEQLVLTAADSAFIAQARTLVPALIAEVQELRELQSQRTNLVEETSGLVKTAARLTAESESLANRCHDVADENERLTADVANWKRRTEETRELLAKGGHIWEATIRDRDEQKARAEKFDVIIAGARMVAERAQAKGYQLDADYILGILEGGE
jgi:hypothetical protein